MQENQQICPRTTLLQSIRNLMQKVLSENALNQRIYLPQVRNCQPSKSLPECLVGDADDLNEARVFPPLQKSAKQWCENDPFPRKCIIQWSNGISRYVSFLEIDLYKWDSLAHSNPTLSTVILRMQNILNVAHQRKCFVKFNVITFGNLKIDFYLTITLKKNQLINFITKHRANYIKKN